VPAVATFRHAAGRQLGLGYTLGFASYALGLAVSVVTDLPSSAVIVWCMAMLAIALHLTAKNGNGAGSPLRSGG
jgi:zinc/manganese transport system permease protein